MGGDGQVNWERLKRQLDHILGARFRLEQMALPDWQNLVERSDSGGSHVVFEETAYFELQQDRFSVRVLSVEEVFLTETEKRLVELAVEANREAARRAAGPPRSEEESICAGLGQWIVMSLEQGAGDLELPEAFASQSALFLVRVPLLLYGHYADQRKVSYAGLKKLLESFFDSDLMLIPLQDKEWLILGAETMLHSGEDEERSGSGSSDEPLEETLASVCGGLYEMMTIEGIGECHLSVHVPIIPAKSLLSAVDVLRQSISLGRSFRVGQHIHLPWTLHLEKLLHSMPESQRKDFVDNVLGRIDYIMDAETTQTLEAFFEANCNVSETAKKLYIHRNTLLYRLDKFRQETGYDIRAFEHAVLVKVALLLYKVTKRM